MRPRAIKHANPQRKLTIDRCGNRLQLRGAEALTIREWGVYSFPISDRLSRERINRESVFKETLPVTFSSRIG